MTAPHAAEFEASLPWRELFCHLLDHRGRMLLIGGLVFSMALVAAAVLPPRYRATAILAVLPSPEFTVRQAAGSHEANASALALDQIMKAETEILGSDDLHAATLRKLGPARVYPDVFAPPAPGPARRALHGLLAFVLSPWFVTPADRTAAREEAGLKQFRAHLNVLPAKDSNVITVEFDNRDNAVAAATINAMLELYADRRRLLYDDPQMEIVRREAEAGRAALGQADRALADFKRDHDISDFDQQRTLLLQRRNQADQAVADAAVAASESRARLDALRRQVADEPTNVGIFDERDTDTRLQAVNAGLQDLRARMAAEGQKYTDTSRLMTMLRSQIASHEAEARRLREAADASVVRRGRNPALDPLRLDRDRAAGELAASVARLGAEQAARQGVADMLAALDAAEADLLPLQRRRATIEENVRIAGRILADRHLSEAEEAQRLANVRVIQPATVPQHPRALPLLVIIAGLMFAPLTALGWVMSRYLLRPVFLTGEGLATATGLPVLAVFALENERAVGAPVLA